MPPVKRMNVREFRERGYLQELNRRFLHPLGLALEVVIERCGCDDGEIEEGPAGATWTAICPTCDGTGKRERLGGVWDYRVDPEGIFYADVDPEDLAGKFAYIENEIAARRRARVTALGYWIQPVVEEGGKP